MKVGSDVFTNPHHDQKSRAEPPKVDYRVALTLHEIILIRTATTYKVR